MRASAALREALAAVDKHGVARLAAMVGAGRSMLVLLASSCLGAATAAVHLPRLPGQVLPPPKKCSDYGRLKGYGCHSDTFW